MTQTRSVVIESVKRAHRLLEENLRRLEEISQPNSAANLDDLRSRLSKTYTYVCEHFRLEEQDCFADDLRQNDARFQRLAQDLIDEHRELRQALDLLHAEAVTASRVDEALRGKIRHWIERIRSHEFRENDLIQDAFESDMGAQD
jgi:hypothetical protein